ncbi:hypothetical protein B7494_g8057 [Chlorociboria aeruginascens]|nr:hypothetical protein B7494_g8057 [Chlorociboria aeruginascens]
MVTDLEMDIDLMEGDEDLALVEDAITVVSRLGTCSWFRSQKTNSNPKPDEYEQIPKLNAAPHNADASDQPHQHTREKVHLRGLDNLNTSDLRAFASEYFSGQEIDRIEWIDDSSANIVYSSPDIAEQALLAFSAVEISDASQLQPLQTVPAKSFPLHPETSLEVRLAVIGDRKQAGARDRSRYYLFHPEHDPAERRKKGGFGRRGGNMYRDREDDIYCSQRYDDREHRKRQIEDEDSGFNASLYDDDEAALANRIGHRSGSISSGSSFNGQGGRRVRFRGAAGKELFPGRGGRADRSSGRLRGRSASPVRNEDGDMGRSRDTAASANRLKAQMIKAQLRDSRSTKELFPHKAGTSISHYRSDAFDAADSTADLFASRMAVPFTDGSADVWSTNGSTLASRVTGDLIGRLTSKTTSSGGFAIRGGANVSGTQAFTIKGASNAVKELFPRTGNSGKELFSERLEGRGGRRQKAEDLFY